MATERDWVIRVPRSDEPNAFVLVHIAPSGDKALDLKLSATEGENPYVTLLKQSRLKELRSKSFQGSDEELENIVISVFKYGFSSPDLNEEPSQHADIEVNATIRQSNDKGNQLVIAIRKRIDTITQRVASITLSQDDDEEIELFEWTGLMATRADSLTRQISSLRHRLQEAEDSIKSLNTTISELVTTKNDHETALIGNFVHIINEKKLKIRNQQRLLAAARIDENKISELQSAVKQHDAQRSRHGKRKVSDREGGASDTDDDFESMNVGRSQGDIDARESKELSDQRETPQPLEEETESEAEEALSTASEANAIDGSDSVSQHSKKNRPRLADPAEPPPRRELPFSRKANSKAVESFRGDDMNEEVAGGETDDDEL